MELFKNKKKKEIKEHKKEPIKKDEISGLIDATPIEAIYPFVYKENKDCVEMGGNYIKVIAFTSYPSGGSGSICVMY